MAAVDTVVVIALLIGIFVLHWRLRHGGLRGVALVRSGWIGASGLVFTVSMAAHSGDVLARWFVGAGYGGDVWRYDFRIYSLLLLGALLIAAGARLIHAAFRLEGVASRHVASRTAVNTTLFVLLLVVPLLPIQTLFAALFTCIATVNLIVLWLHQRSATRRRAEPPAAVPAQPALSEAMIHPGPTV